MIVTNGDQFIPIKGMRFPGNGAILSSILLTTNLKQSTVGREDEPGTYDLIGKPNPYCLSLIQDEHNLTDKSRTVMIGDRPSTDIAFGKAGGVDTCLVMTGVVKNIDDFKENWTEFTPTYFMNMFGQLEAS